MTGADRKIVGRICLVGAGPGDEGLITVRGLELLRPALAITFDEGESDFDALLRRWLPVPGKKA